MWSAQNSEFGAAATLLVCLSAADSCRVCVCVCSCKLSSVAPSGLVGTADSTDCINTVLLICVTRHNTVHSSIVSLATTQFTAVLCHSPQHSSQQYCVARHNTAHSSIVSLATTQLTAVLYRSPQHSSQLCCIARHNTAHNSCRPLVH